MLGILEVLLKILLKRYGSRFYVNACILSPGIQCFDQPVQNTSTNI